MTLPAIFDCADFDEEAATYLMERAAAAHVDRVLEEAQLAADARARRAGIQAAKAFLELPDWLDGALETLCYGPTLETRKVAAELLNRWLDKKAAE